MHTGMLWFDNSKTPLNIKIQKGTEYFMAKHGKTPDLILLHPSMLEAGKGGSELEINCTYRANGQGDLIAKQIKVAVRPYRPVLPGHIWIGIKDK